MTSNAQLILGIWDGHDAGVALVAADRILFAINEERLSRRKLEIGFPRQSIAAALEFSGMKANDIGGVAVSTTDFAKTLTRWFPSMREEYYLIRRRKKYPGPLTRFKKRIKYRLTEWPPSALTRALSRQALRRELTACGLGSVSLTLVDHHAAHAAGAALTSGFEKCLVLTIDGIGDALSGSLWSLEAGQLTPLGTLPGTASLGVFFEHVTNLMNMRELEDEGKVMALANYAYPVPDADNPMLKYFTVDGLALQARYSSLRLYKDLSRVLWRFPPEQFAYMAQRTLEVKVVELIRNALARTGHTCIAYAGGVASNVKVNMLIRELPEVEDLYVFPHMGDGGLALGAALWANQRFNGISRYDLQGALLGPDFTDSDVRDALREYPQFTLQTPPDIVETAAELIAKGEIILWCQGRMEFGPRALGARSILARPDSAAIKDALNLKLKRRVWYQPFCPTMLQEDALEILADYNGRPNPYMTCAYRVRPEHRATVQGVINVDGSCRPQILTSAGTDPYTCLLKAVKRKTGLGVLLNTSLNLHGEPLVCSPKDTLRTFEATEVGHLVAGHLLVSKDGFAPPNGIQKQKDAN